MFYSHYLLNTFIRDPFSSWFSPLLVSSNPSLWLAFLPYSWFVAVLYYYVLYYSVIYYFLFTLFICLFHKTPFNINIGFLSFIFPSNITSSSVPSFVIFIPKYFYTDPCLKYTFITLFLPLILYLYSSTSLWCILCRLYPAVQ